MSYREKRHKLSLSQIEVSKAVGLDQSILSKIENNNRSPTEEQRKLLDDFYSRFSLESPLTAKIDYFKMSFKIVDVRLFCEEVLGINFDNFKKGGGAKNYQYSYSFAGVINVFLAETGDNRGILLELKGQGCRQYEEILEILNSNWQEFFQKCLDYKGKCTRLDIALDDSVELFPLDEMKECLENNYYKTKFISGYEVVGGSTNQGSKGITIYFGSKKSELHFCFYQKNYEIARKERIDVSEVTEVKNRYEVRFKQDKANKMVRRFSETFDVLSATLSVIQEKVTIFENLNTSSGVSLVHHKWANLFDSPVDVDLSVDPRHVDFDTMRNWVGTQVIQVLKTLRLHDYLTGNSYLEDMINNTVLNEKYERMLEDVLLDATDIIYNDEPCFTLESAVKLYLIQLDKKLSLKARFYNLTEFEKKQFMASEELLLLGELENNSRYLNKEMFYEVMTKYLDSMHVRLNEVQILIKNSYQKNIPFD